MVFTANAFVTLHYEMCIIDCLLKSQKPTKHRLKSADPTWTKSPNQKFCMRYFENLVVQVIPPQKPTYRC